MGISALVGGLLDAARDRSHTETYSPAGTQTTHYKAPPAAMQPGTTRWASDSFSAVNPGLAPRARRYAGPRTRPARSGIDVGGPEIFRSRSLVLQDAAGLNYVEAWPCLRPAWLPGTSAIVN